MESIKSELEKTLSFLKQSLGKLRVGRATPALVEDVKADYYGTLTPIKQLATINTPELDLIVITPWDKSSIGTIEKAILGSNIGINPIVDKDIIRLKMPSLTEERRKEFVKLLNKEIEEGRVTIRNIREKCREETKELSGINEDEKFKKLEEIDKLVKEYNDKLEEVRESKEREIMSV